MEATKKGLEVTEDELWGKLTYLLSLTAEKNREKTIIVMMEAMRGSFVDPVALSWYVDANLKTEIKAVCADLGIAADDTPDVKVIREKGH